jgi:predicted dehydrogenase
MKRRSFNKLAGTIIVGAPLINSSKLSILGANERINFGVIGANGMGWSNANSLLKNKEAICLGIADVDSRVLSRRMNNYSEIRDNKPTLASDYRRLLDNKDIDAIVIGTPDHWHCKMMVDAVEAGKHVYVEKPAANSIEECQIMTKAAQRSGKMVQVGQWQRSGLHYKKAIDIVQSGSLGQIRLVKTWAYQGWMKPIKPVADSEPPVGVDYKNWLGPAPLRSFNPNRFHFNFRWFWDYAGGLMTDWGVHEIDIALLAMRAGRPISVTASGGKFAYPDDASETPDTLQAIFQYPKFNMLWEHATGIDLGPYGKREGIAFIGNNGTLVLNRQGFEVIREYESNGYSSEGEPLMNKIESMNSTEGVNYVDLHTVNFLKAIKENNYHLLEAPIESGANSAINAQMGNISYKIGRKVRWDDTTKLFINDNEANQMIKSIYHNGIKKPS